MVSRNPLAVYGPLFILVSIHEGGLLSMIFLVLWWWLRKCVGGQSENPFLVSEAYLPLSMFISN